MDSILSNLTDLRQRIRSNPRLSFDETQWHDFVDISESNQEWTLDDLKEIANLRMEPRDASILKISGMKVVWESTLDGLSVYGGFRFNGIYEALANPSTFWKVDFSLPSDVPVPDELKHFEKLNWFEQQGRDGSDWRYTCFKRGSETFPVEIVFFDKNWYTKLDLTLDAYFAAMLDSCAIKGWQYFHIDWNQDVPHRAAALEDMEKAVKLLPVLFPDQDFSFHEARLKSVKGQLR